MTTANEYKRYKDLLDALANCLEVNGGDGKAIDPFLTGYAGAEWEAAKEKARWRATIAACRKAKEAKEGGGNGH